MSHREVVLKKLKEARAFSKHAKEQQIVSSIVLTNTLFPHPIRFHLTWNDGYLNHKQLAITDGQCEKEMQFQFIWLLLLQLLLLTIKFAENLHFLRRFISSSLQFVRYTNLAICCEFLRVYLFACWLLQACRYNKQRYLTHVQDHFLPVQLRWLWVRSQVLGKWKFLLEKFTFPSPIIPTRDPIMLLSICPVISGWW